MTGVLNTGVHVVIVALFLRYVSANPPLANAVAFCVATAVSFSINSVWSFSKPIRGDTFAKFLAVSLLGCGLTVSVSALAHTWGYPPAVGVIFVVMVVPPFTFLLHRSWTYRI